MEVRDHHPSISFCFNAYYYSKLHITVKEESEKLGLKLNIQKTKIIASGSITSWQIDEETMETVTNFILGGSKITAGGDWHPLN